MLKKIKTTILRFFFPARCLGCKQEPNIKDNQTRDFICPQCLKEINYSYLSQDKNIYTVSDYSDPIIKRAVWLLKYQHIKSLAEPLAELIYRRLFVDKFSGSLILKESGNPGGLALNPQEGKSSGIATNWLIIPIPLFKTRLRERGFNQSELIAKYLSDKLLLNQKMSVSVLNNVLYKKFHTDTQVSVKDRKKRLKNLEGSFGIQNKNLVKNKNIILIDDVATTGATFSEAVKTLRPSKPKSIICIAAVKG